VHGKTESTSQKGRSGKETPETHFCLPLNSRI
jgi:hypothetical protein